MPKKPPRTTNPASSSTAAKGPTRYSAIALVLSRVPLDHDGVDVNFCKNPQCSNFGVPIPTSPAGFKVMGAGGPYRLVGRGKTFSIVEVRCQSCGEQFPLKSNVGIAEELARMRAPLASATPLYCPDPSCAHHAVAVGVPGAYKAFGRLRSGNPRWMCKACGKTVSRNARATTGQRRTSKNRMLFRLLVSKTPLTRIAELIDADNAFIQRRIRFIHEQCVAFAGARERKLADIAIPRLYISVDAQEHFVNWRSRKDRRNVVLAAVASVDNETGYCFGMHLNFDPSLNAAAVEADALANGDPQKPVPLRQHARIWLSSDYVAAATRIAARQAAKAALGVAALPSAPSLSSAIDSAYDTHQDRDDIESPDDPSAEHRLPDKGMQIRRDYTLYAHFEHLRRLCPNVEKWRFFLDQDSGIRAACLAAFHREVKVGNCDAFYVSINKELTIDQKRKARAAAKSAFATARAAHPGKTEHEVVVELMKIALAVMKPHGGWGDRWLDHPLPSMSEPEKAVAWLTERPGMALDHVASLHHKASLHGVDSLFNRMRRRVSLLERPIRSSSAKRVWTAYAPYDPAQAARLIEIVRVCHNFIWTGKDGKTPAVRLGLARVPLDYEDVLSFVP